MIETTLTRRLGLTIPVVGAPMTPFAGGKLAAAVCTAGGLGTVGISSAQAVSTFEDDVRELRALAPGKPFGVGLMAWALARRPEVLDAALAAKPTMIIVSFGDIAPYAERIKRAGILLASQVQNKKSALAAELAGADVLIAQGTEAGGHTGAVGTLPLLQIVLDAVKTPVLAAGGIATGRGLAAVLAAGAQGALVGTPLLVADEARTSEAARARLLAAEETQTTLTSAFDRVQKIAWPAEFKGRALTNAFVARWNGHEDEIDDEARRAFDEARRADDYDTANLYAGQSVGALSSVRPAAAIVRAIAGDAEQRLVQLRSVVAS